MLGSNNSFHCSTLGPSHSQGLSLSLCQAPSTKYVLRQLLKSWVFQYHQPIVHILHHVLHLVWFPVTFVCRSEKCATRSSKPSVLCFTVSLAECSEKISQRWKSQCRVYWRECHSRRGEEWWSLHGGLVCSNHGWEVGTACPGEEPHTQSHFAQASVESCAYVACACMHGGRVLQHTSAHVFFTTMWSYCEDGKKRRKLPSVDWTAYKICSRALHKRGTQIRKLKVQDPAMSYPKCNRSTALPLGASWGLIKRLDFCTKSCRYHAPCLIAVTVDIMRTCTKSLQTFCERFSYLLIVDAGSGMDTFLMLTFS